MTQEEIERLRALERSATPGEWRFDHDGLCISGKEHTVCDLSNCEDHPGMADPDADFIVAARNALPALLEELSVEVIRAAQAEAFKAGQAAGLAHAANICDRLHTAWRFSHDDMKAAGAFQCSSDIRSGRLDLPLAAEPAKGRSET